MITVDLRKDLNTALRLITEKLDLDETRYQNAREKYAAVGNWFEADDSELGEVATAIYPQGSFSLGTVVKPVSAEEYDIDLVWELETFQGNPDELKQLVGDRLKENETYKSRLEEMNRCWRINYAGEFHLDILPARLSKPNQISDTAIEVPDKDLHNWVPSDPRGYTSWFKSRMIEQFRINRQLLAQVEKKSIDDVPEYKVKTTLQQAVQLLKRNRDIMFEHDGDDKPISILITTLAGRVYSNQADLFVTLSDSVKNMHEHIENRNGIAWVPNPANPKENFVEKWEKHPQRKQKFFKWLKDLEKSLESIRECSDIQEAENILKEVFGENLMMSVMQNVSGQKEKHQTREIKTPPVVKIKQPNPPWQKDGL